MSEGCRLLQAVVGQPIATSLLVTTIFNHFADQSAGKPLVLMLIGPPGHGKTCMGGHIGNVTLPLRMLVNTCCGAFTQVAAHRQLVALTEYCVILSVAVLTR